MEGRLFCFHPKHFPIANHAFEVRKFHIPVQSFVQFSTSKVVAWLNFIHSCVLIQAAAKKRRAACIVLGFWSEI